MQLLENFKLHMWLILCFCKMVLGPIMAHLEYQRRCLKGASPLALDLGNAR